ncbi:putative MFS-type transporter YcaD [mine drainage metagenome]|uniref:Putative MFS-type transporter YcaD n=1 Tax=mine drainage metagenome TaxID=410659 RepID=A0A1J5PTS6_9ZZZZ
MTSRDFSLTSLIPGVFLPTIIFEIGVGAILPVIALTGLHLGASVAGAGLLVSMLAIGQILGDVPAGALAARVGDRRAMSLAATVTIATLSASALARSVWLLGAGVLATGAANAVFMLARQSYLTEASPVLRRARALSTLAGVQRIGTFIGPFAGALVIHLAGTGSVYWLAAGTSLVAAVIVAVVPDVADPSAAHARAAGVVPVRRILTDHRQVFLTLGVAVLTVGAVRGARQTILPLWTEHLGMSATTTSLVFGLSGAVDMLLFYPSGKVMDRMGRLWVAIPSMLVMAVAMIALPFSRTVATVSVVAMVLGFGNGIGSGILMTLGADVAPADRRAQFLGVWRVIQDTGNAGGPLLVAAGAALGSLGGGILATGATAVVAAGALARWVPQWSVHANRSTRRRAAERSAGVGLG